MFFFESRIQIETMIKHIKSMLFGRSYRKQSVPRQRLDDRAQPELEEQTQPHPQRICFEVDNEPAGCRVLRCLSYSDGVLEADVLLSGSEKEVGVDHFERFPARESMRRRQRGRLYEKELKPKTSALKRFLVSRLGRSFNEVKSELYRRCDLRTFAGHILQERLDSILLSNVAERDGKLYDVEFNRELSESFSRLQFFVHPRTGKLERVPRASKRSLRSEPSRPEQVEVSRTERLVRHNGIWFMVEMKAIPHVNSLPEPYPAQSSRAFAPQKPRGPVDVILGKEAVEDPANVYRQWPNKKADWVLDAFVQAWGARVYAANKRQACSKELRRAGVAAN
ncbi:MAG: hypothetical protein K2X27_09520 [Candidatus Obscuribacterales bacterium]|nr:hypothetical protein [Candidatus Obscuribacterales bacterium]